MPTNKPKLKYYWHIHHDRLCEYTYDISERIKYIKENKPKREIPARLRLIKPVQHPDKLPLRFRNAADATAKTYAACDKALAASTKAYDAYDKAYAAYDKAYAAYEKACAAYDKALRMPQIEELHREEHPNWPWKGKTIFPK